MYESLFGLIKPPFANVPDPEFLYMSGEHQKGLSILRYALIARDGFCVITGDVGAGKTTLVRSILQDLDVPVHVGLVSNTQCDSFEELLRWILLAFDLDYRNRDKVQMYDEFVQFLISKYNSSEPVTLIIDEAQNLSLDLLEQLRMLSNVNTEKGQILQTILVGQPELWDLLRDPKLIQFAQRVSHDFFLKPLEQTETIKQYIEHRLRVAGSDKQIFDEECFDFIMSATQGVPRLINLVCDAALVYAYGEGSEQVTGELVARVVEDKKDSFAPVKQNASVKKASEEPVMANTPRSNGQRKFGLSTIEKAAQIARLTKT